jgi:hypothetical protein
MFRLLGKGKRKRKASVVIGLGELEIPAVIFDNGFGQTQTQAGTLADGLGGEEGFHDARPKFGRHTGPAIDDGENNGLLLAGVSLASILRSRHVRLSNEGVLTPQTPFGMTG